MIQCLGFQGAWQWPTGLFGRAMAPKIHLFKSPVQSPESRSSPGNSASRKIAQSAILLGQRAIFGAGGGGNYYNDSKKIQRCFKKSTLVVSSCELKLDAR